MKDFLKRLHLLFCVKLTSINGVVWIVATIQFFRNEIPWYGWLICSGIVLSYKAIQKIKDLILTLKGFVVNKDKVVGVGK